MARGSGWAASVRNDPAAIDTALRVAVEQIDAAVSEQERAAARIMGLAELLLDRAEDPATRLRIEAVMECCAVYDITDQRLRRVRALLSNLTALPPGTLRVDSAAGEMSAAVGRAGEPLGAGGPGLTQEQVDRLLGKR